MAETGKGRIMRKARWGALVALIGTFAVGLLWTTPAHSQPRPVLGPLPAEFARQSRLQPEDATRALNAFGPVVSQQLAASREVSIPNMGVFRVVNIPQHVNLVDGRPTTIPARNIVEFLPDAALTRAANSPQARPAVVVPPFQYIPLPGQTPSTRLPDQRIPSRSSRVP
jgi:nucleoid DNA-binding protein